MQEGHLLQRLVDSERILKFFGVRWANVFGSVGANHWHTLSVKLASPACSGHTAITITLHYSQLTI